MINLILSYLQIYVSYEYHLLYKNIGDFYIIYRDPNKYYTHDFVLCNYRQIREYIYSYGWCIRCCVFRDNVNMDSEICVPRSYFYYSIK